MEKRILPGLKITFLVHVVAALAFGLIYLLVPTRFADLVDWSIKDTDIVRMLGAAVLAFAASSWFGFRAQRWEQVKIIVLMELVWTFLDCLLVVLAVLAGRIPAAGWLNIVIMAGFFLAFGWFYLKQEEQR